MKDTRQIIAANISALRKAAGYTQLALAEKLQYSDKAVSKWESGASIPDVTVLMDIAKLFGVTVDDLLTEDHSARPTAPAAPDATSKNRMHFVIALLSVALVWLLATGVFVVLSLIPVSGPLWISFIWAVPVSCIVAIVFNSIWSNPRRNYVYISLLMWTALAAVYLSLLAQNLWLIFVLGIPGQAIIILWAGMKALPRSPLQETKEAKKTAETEEENLG